ncbi:hypothetical protein PNOK_0450900 [Pyrrhoderma noxium]|uniref:F-box domain-containing protein n=1 Tax=Pyrrhoderma noxium TaxID=2282107 RepID=A0A286UJB9_9AGAM|nr:hypothetical protein PNOK_0450900 [Pyrrhoderma noxium]
MALPFDDGEESIFTNSEDEDYVDNHPSVGNIDIINNDTDDPITIANLPTEIIASIASHLSRNSLAALSLTSHRLQSISERLLYAAISVRDILGYSGSYKTPFISSSSSQSSFSELNLELGNGNINNNENENENGRDSIIPCKTQGLCMAIARRPHLASCVRYLSIRWSCPSSLHSHHAQHHQNRAMSDGSGREQTGPPTIDPSFATTLHILLVSLSHLKHLELHLSGLPNSKKDFGFSFPSLLEGASFPLRRLISSGASPFPSPVSPPISLESILRSLPTLTHLHLPAHYPPLVGLTPSDLPVLQSFRGSIRCAASVIPGRPVSDLSLCLSSDLETISGLSTGLGYYGGFGLPHVSYPELTGGSPSIEQDPLSFLLLGSSPVRKLDLSAMSVTPTQLLFLSKYFGRDLEVLRMKLALRHTLHFTFSGMMLLSALTHLLGSFPSLQVLDLSPTVVDGKVPIHKNAREEHTLCSAWAGVLPSLRWVRFPSGIVWIKGEEQDGEWKSKISGTSPGSGSKPKLVGLSSSSSSSLSPPPPPSSLSSAMKEKNREVEEPRSKDSSALLDRSRPTQMPVRRDDGNEYPNIGEDGMMLDNTSSSSREKGGERDRNMDVDSPELVPSSSSTSVNNIGKSTRSSGGVGAAYDDLSIQSSSYNSTCNTNTSANTSTSTSFSC